MNNIPALRPPHLTPPIRTDADLHRQWRALMGPLGFDTRMLWMLVLESDGTLVPSIPRIDDLPLVPTPRVVRGLLHVGKRLLREVDRRGSVALLLSRPGGQDLTDSDLAWMDALKHAATAIPLNLRRVHLACDEAVVTLDPPALAA